MDRDAFISAVIRELEKQKLDGDESISAPAWQTYGNSERRIKMSPGDALRKVSNKFQFDFPLVDESDLIQASEAICQIEESPIAEYLHLSPKFIENLDYVASKGNSRAAADFVKTTYCCMSNELLRCSKKDLCAYFFGSGAGASTSKPIDAKWFDLFGHVTAFLATSRSVLVCLQQQKNDASTESSDDMHDVGGKRKVSPVRLASTELFALIEVLRMLRNALTTVPSQPPPGAANVKTLENLMRLHPSHVGASEVLQHLVSVDEVHEIKEAVLKSFFNISYLIRDVLVVQPGLVPDCMPALFDVLCQFDEGLSKSMAESDDESVKDSIHSVFILVFGHLIEGLLSHKAKMDRSNESEKFDHESIGELFVVLDWLGCFVEGKLPDIVGICRSILEECVAETAAAINEDQEQSATTTTMATTQGKVYQLSSIVCNITDLLAQQALAKGNASERLIPLSLSSVLFDIIAFQSQSLRAVDTRLSRVLSRVCLNDRAEAPVGPELMALGAFRDVLTYDAALVADSKAPPPSADNTSIDAEIHPGFRLFGAHVIGMVVGLAGTTSRRLKLGLVSADDASIASLSNCLSHLLFGSGEATGVCLLRRHLLEARNTAEFARCLAPSFADLMADLLPPQIPRPRAESDTRTYSWAHELFSKNEASDSNESFRKHTADVVLRWVQQLNSFSSGSLPGPTAPLTLSDQSEAPIGDDKKRSTSWDWADDEEKEAIIENENNATEEHTSEAVKITDTSSAQSSVESEGRAILDEALSMARGAAENQGSDSISNHVGLSHHEKENVESKTIVSAVDYHKIKYAIKSLKLLIDSFKMGTDSGVSARKLD